MGQDTAITCKVNTIQYNIRKYKTRHTTQDNTIEYEIRQYKTIQYNIRHVKIGQDKTRQANTIQ